MSTTASSDGGGQDQQPHKEKSPSTSSSSSSSVLSKSNSVKLRERKPSLGLFQHSSKSDKASGPVKVHRSYSELAKESLLKEEDQERKKLLYQQQQQQQRREKSVHANNFVHMTDCVPPILMTSKLSFNRSSWHEASATSNSNNNSVANSEDVSSPSMGSIRSSSSSSSMLMMSTTNSDQQQSRPRRLSKQASFEGTSPSPPKNNAPTVQRNHSLKYSGGALHGEGGGSGGAAASLEFDHNFVREDEQAFSDRTAPRNHSDYQNSNNLATRTMRFPPLVRVSTDEEVDHDLLVAEEARQRQQQQQRESSPNNLQVYENENNSSASNSSPPQQPQVQPPPPSPKQHRPQHPQISVAGGGGLGRCQSFKQVRGGGHDLRSSAMLRSASGTALARLSGSQASLDNQDQDRGSTPASPGMPVPLLPIKRDSFNMNQGKSRSMTCLLAAAASAAEIAGRPVLVSDARTRSYLCGSVGHVSLLGAEELEKYFPDKKVRMFIGTWNMNGQTPPHYLADFLLPLHIEYVPDILVIATQESLPERTEWEVRLQETLGPSHVLFHSAALGTLHLSVFLRRDLIWFCSIPEVDSFSTRPGAQFKTKGAVAIAFILFGTSFLFVNSHLTAHEENVKDRVRDLKKINAMLNLPKILPRSRKTKVQKLTGASDFSDNFDCVFWCGDLNFRLEQSRDVVMREVEGGASVLDFDQLNYFKKEGLIFRGYSEDEIKFQPTFKYDTGTNQYDTSSKRRVPSYTDRILYKCQPYTKINPLHYDSVQDVVTSDHKPVWGMWEVNIRPGKDNLPLSGGLFNREVYLEGLKRRSEALHPPSSGKMSCTIQ